MTNQVAEIAVPVLPELIDAIPSFERPGVAMAAAGALAVSTAVSVYQSRRVEAMAADDAEMHNQFAGGSDQAEVAQKHIRHSKWKGWVAGIALSSALGAGIADAANPYTEEQVALADSVTLVIEAGADASAGDVVDEKKGEDVSRVSAGVNSGLRFASRAGEDVTVNFVLAGTNPKSIGSVRGNEGVTEVLDASNDYLDNLSNLSAPDIKGALAVSEATEADYKIVLTTTDVQANVDALATNESEKTIISVGRPDTNYSYLGQERRASFNSQFGNVKARTAESTEELAEILDEVSEREVSTTKNQSSKLFEHIRNGGIAVLALFGAGRAVNMVTYKRRKGDL